MADYYSVIYYSNDNTLEVRNLAVQGTGSAVADAVVTATVVKEQTYAEVSGQTWPVTLSYVAASTLYRGTLKDEMVLTPEEKVIAQITASGGTNLKGYWEFPLICKTRTS